MLKNGIILDRIQIDSANSEGQHFCARGGNGFLLHERAREQAGS